MSRLHAIELHLLMLAGIAFLCVSGWQVLRVGKTLDAANGAISQVNGAIQGINGTIANMNRPCKGKAGPDACGMLAQVNESVIRIDDAVTTMQIQVKQTGKLTDAAAKSIGRASDDLYATTLAIQGTANAASQTLHGASLTLSTMNDSIAATKPLIEASTATVKLADAVISNPAIPKIETRIQGMTDSGDKMLSDAQWKTHQLLHPPKKKLGFWGGFWVGMQYVHKMLPPIF